VGIAFGVAACLSLEAWALLRRGDLSRATALAERAIASTDSAPHMGLGYQVLARIERARGDIAAAEEAARHALQLRESADLYTADALEVLSAVVAGRGRHDEAARLFGAASAFRQRTGLVRYASEEADYQTDITKTREALGAETFAKSWDEGAALSIDEALAYATRGRGERKRPSTGWESLTPGELDVVRLVADGLANKEIAGKLFVSPRTVQAHLTHIYSKLGTSSRVQLAKEAAARA
jgi:DNA-binding CsgD family transcriptional regulator